MLSLLRSLVLIVLAVTPLRAQDGWESIQPAADLKGWTRIAIPPSAPPAAEQQWRVENGLLICDGDRGHEWLRFDREFADLVFHVEFRYPVRDGNPRYNSGIFIRNDETGVIWHQVQVGGASGGYIFGNTPRQGKPQRINLKDAMTEMRVKPAGEWNELEVTARGAVISAKVNGAVVSEFKECELQRGHIGLEAEGHRVEFRNLRIKLLP